MNDHDRTGPTPFATAADTLDMWPGRIIELWFAHEPSGDARIARFTGLKIERVERLDESDEGFDGARLTLSVGGKTVGEVIIEEQLLVTAAADPTGVALRLGDILVVVAEESEIDSDMPLTP